MTADDHAFIKIPGLGDITGPLSRQLGHVGARDPHSYYASISTGEYNAIMRNVEALFTWLAERVALGLRTGRSNIHEGMIVHPGGDEVGEEVYARFLDSNRHIVTPHLQYGDGQKVSLFERARPTPERRRQVKLVNTIRHRFAQELASHGLPFDKLLPAIENLEELREKNKLIATQPEEPCLPLFEFGADEKLEAIAKSGMIHGARGALSAIHVFSGSLVAGGGVYKDASALVNEIKQAPEKFTLPEEDTTAIMRNVARVLYHQEQQARGRTATV